MSCELPPRALVSGKAACYLRCVDNSHPPILLPDKKELILGRCQETKITEKRCSKNQLSFIADSSNYTVKVKQVGPNTSAFNHTVLGRNKVRVACHGDAIYFLLGMFKHILIFDPPPKEDKVIIDAHSGVKRSADDSISSVTKRAKMEGVLECVEPSTVKRWESVSGGKLLFYESEGVSISNKIAAYDMDGTLIVTKSGKVFPQHEGDWKIQWPEIPKKLKSLHDDGFKIVILTNQAGISRGKTTATEIKKKIEKVVSELGVPAQALVATGNSLYRKPAPGMWDFLTSSRNSGEQVDISLCFYCGDAAGRPENKAAKKKKDFSCSDLLFARNLGLTFFCPEEHFLGQRAPHSNLPDFDPAASPPASLVDPTDCKITSDRQELLLMVGVPGSGKSFVCRTYLTPNGYVHVNRDTLGSWQKCVAAVKSSLKSGKRVVVDNTNPDPESRSRFIEVAKECNIPCRCAVMNSSISLARHNNKFRELIGEDHEPVSEIIINSFKSKFQEPTLSEGFEEVFKVNVIPKFNNVDHERLYKMYLLDKY